MLDLIPVIADNHALRAMRDFVGAHTSEAVVLILGLIGGVVLSRFTSDRMCPSWDSITTSLIQRDKDASPTDITVQFRGKEVPVVSVTNILLWNAGRKTINRDDVTQAEPISIIPDNDVEILTADVIEFNESANRLTLGEVTNKQVPIQFDYMQYRQGALIKVIHTGSGTKGVKVIGKVKSAGPVKYRNVDGGGWQAALALLGLIAAVVVLGFIITKFGTDAAGNFTGIGVLILVGGISILALLFVGLLLRRIPSAPKNFKSFRHPPPPRTY